MYELRSGNGSIKHEIFFILYQADNDLYMWEAWQDGFPSQWAKWPETWTDLMPHWKTTKFHFLLMTGIEIEKTIPEELKDNVIL